MNTIGYSQLQKLEVKEIESNGAIPIFTEYPDYTAVIIYTSLSKLSFSSNMGVISEKSDPEQGKYILIVRPTRQALRIQCPGFMEANYKTPTLAPKDVLYLSVEQATAPEIPVVIRTDPEDAIVIVDSVDLGYGPTYKIATGPHDIIIKMPGYRTIDEKITISDDSSMFSYKLIELEPQSVIIKSNPIEANIDISGKSYGVTDKEILLLPGKYLLRLSKSDYEPIVDTIMVSESDKNEFDYNLKKTTATIIFKVVPVDVSITIDGGEIKESQEEVPFGPHIIKIFKDGYYTYTKSIDAQKGEEIPIDVELEKITGNLEFTIEPMNSNSLLQNGEETIRKWSGSEYLKDIPIGKYQIISDARGYALEKTSIQITENNTSKLSITLNKQYGIVPLKDALLRSTLLPGFGQLHEERYVASVAYFSSELFLGYALINLRNKHNDLESDYLSIRQEYEHSRTTEEIQAAWHNVRDAYDEMDKNYTYQKIVAGTMIGVYLWNIVDSWAFMPKISEKNVQASFFNTNDGIGVLLGVNLP